MKEKIATMMEAQILSEIIRLVLIGSTIFIGFLLIWFITHVAKRTLQRRFTAHTTVLLTNILFYFGIFIVAITVVHEAGFKLSAIFGAAGIIGIAFGFAAQASISNIVSGLFLLIERPFLVGDFVVIEDVAGIVDSINLLSITVITPDKMLVRVPNELVVKHSITNRTFFKQQRMDLQLQVSNVDVLSLLPDIQHTLAGSDLILKKPSPILVISAVDGKGVTLLFRSWVDTSTNMKINIYNKLAQRMRTLSEEKGVPIAISKIKVK